MERILRHGAKLFDWIHLVWTGPRGHKAQGSLLVLTFIGTLVLIELNRRNLLLPPLSGILPTNHLGAIEISFSLLLLLEAAELVFCLAKSVSISVGKQLEILSLILIRNTFKIFAHFQEPLAWTEIKEAILPISSSAVSALLIFVIAGIYYKMLEHPPITSDTGERATFIAAKKNIALTLFFCFTIIIVDGFWNFFVKGIPEAIFEEFYTMLVFSDVLIVLISVRYGSGFQVSFRNSAFAVATIFMRLSLIAPVVVSGMTGVGAALFTLGVIIAYNRFFVHDKRSKKPAG